MVYMGPFLNKRLYAIFCLSVLLALTIGARASYAAAFAEELLYLEDGETHRLVLTGASERVVLFFDVYEIAHYAEPVGSALTPAAVLAEGLSKALVIVFDRKLSVARIRDEFAKSLRRNAQPGWLEQAAPSVEAFIRAIDRDAAPGDRLDFYWLSGGRLVATFNGEPAFSVTDSVFAKLIWSIWFGEDPVCDREELLARVVSGDNP